MKFVRLFIFFLLALVVTIALFSFFLPTQQTVKRTVTIQAPPAVIYEQIARLENFNKWSVWNRQDSSATYTRSGTDGTLGASVSWKGHPQISGEGTMEITALQPNQSVTHHINFTAPRKSKAVSVFLLEATAPATTSLTWNFSMATPRPWNIFNLMYNFDKQMGQDFEDGLTYLKSLIEKSQPVPGADHK